MAIQVSLVIIALALVILVASLVVVFFKIKKATDLIQEDLHKISLESASLISKASDLTADIKNKSECLTSLFKPFGFLNRGHRSESSSEDLSKESKTIPQIIGWIVTGLILARKAKEVIQHDKR